MYKVGDTVKIRDDLIVGKIYHISKFLGVMKEYCRKTAKITKIFEDGSYSIDLDKERFLWVDEMFKE